MEVDCVGIIGIGMMGVAIAAAHLRVGLPVLLYDNSEESLSDAAGRITDELRLQGLLYDSKLVVITDRLNDLCGLRIIIETIPEKVRIKHRLYRNLQQLSQTVTDSKTLLFSNTSTISIAALSEPFSEDWRSYFCGFHFFHPVRERSIVEIIAGQGTSEETIKFAKIHAERLEKRAIVVNDGTGFLVNRILNAYLMSALNLFESGVLMERIERVAVEFGMKMGPFRIMDEIGLDVVLHAGWVLSKAFPERTLGSDILVKLVERRDLGRKTGRGFMIYDSQTQWYGEGIPNPEIIVTKKNNNAITDEQIIKILFGNMRDEALRCFEDGVINNLADADTASIQALGFPESKGGITQLKLKD
ncbi:MAG: 3-hydroxyacyl-CoA dehydrogenase family protein [Planctomycetaceae bacterium]|jgi:3-hydroxyacyl-CoA dehydrogenase/enoyl-CoA hydratase/3-hydroxybutyryl-CoA epimerase|nr:3-hydroxyacyl-CoA dehydrogenase family protein [Planctomycetaceae bacterium]